MQTSLRRNAAAQPGGNTVPKKGPIAPSVASYFQIFSGALFLSCWLLAVANPLHGANPSLESSTSTEARQQAVAAIPLEKVDARYRQSVQQVTTSSSLFRRMPTEVIPCDPGMFSFLSQNPEVLVEIWRHMGISTVSLVRLNDTTFRLADGAGTTCKLVVVEQTCDEQAQNRIVMYGEGAYEGKPFQRPVNAQCVVLLRSGTFREDDGRDFIAARLDTFIRIDRTSVELFAKALHPLVGKTADRNFTDTMTFISNFSQAASSQPHRIEQLAYNLERVTPERQAGLSRVAYESSSKLAVVSADGVVVELATELPEPSSANIKR